MGWAKVQNQFIPEGESLAIDSIVAAILDRSLPSDQELTPRQTSN